MKINIELLLTLYLIAVPVMYSTFAFVFIFTRIHTKWKTKYKTIYDKKLKEKEEKELEAELEKQAVVKPGNPILEYITSRFNVVCYGGLGCGKTLMANLLAKYIINKQEIFDYKNRRQLKYTNPQYLKDLEQLQENCKLNIYSEVDLLDHNTGFTSNELWDYLTQKKKTVENGIYFVDEIGTKFGKDQYNIQQREQSVEYKMAEQTARYARQDTNSRFIATEQDEENIWKPIREKGFVGIKMLGVQTWITKKGKVARAFKNFWLKCAPALLTINSKEVLAVELGRRNKTKAIFKLLLPAYFLLPKQYYIKKIEIAKQIKFDYTQFKINFELNGERKFLLFTNEDIYIYNSRGHKDIYNSKFDENGNRKFVKEA